MFAIYIFIILSIMFVLAAILMASTNRWLAAYLAATAFACVATVAMSYDLDEPIPAPETRVAIQALYAAPNDVQKAIDADICTLLEVDSLTHEGNNQYADIRLAYMAALKADPANAERDFCFAAGER
jgi:sensor histidine kinase regulating citrate/malate metabolism